MFRPMTSDRMRWLLLAVAAIVLVLHTLAYNFVTDDAYISFVYSRNLAEHGELTFNLGQRVEGYTNFSWTALLGLIDEFPVLRAALRASRNPRALSVSASAFEFISESSQIVSIHEFMQSLPDMLRP